MCFFTFSLFGHRKLDDLRRVENLLVPMLKKLLREKTYVTFLIGRNGEFDEYAASLIKGVQRQLGKESSELTLVLLYRMANMEYYEKYYDNIVIPEALHGAYPKFAITLKNRWMVEQSDLVIVNVERDHGGAYTAMQYAQKQNKSMINLFERSL